MAFTRRGELVGCGGGGDAGVDAVKKVGFVGAELPAVGILQHHALWVISAAVADPEGNFPDSLEAVRKGSPNEDQFTMTDPNTGQGEIDPTYFPGLKRDAGAKLILLACPFSNADGTRTVAYTDMSSERIAEADFQAKVAAQGGE